MKNLFKIAIIISCVLISTPCFALVSQFNSYGGIFSVNSSNGFAGIGTSTPSTMLTVNGTVTATAFTGAGTGLTGTAASLTAGNVTTNANLTGDVTSVGNASTLATVNSNVGTFGDSTHSASFTVNGKGLITAVSSASISPAFSAITGKPTTLSGYGITDALSNTSIITAGGPIGSASAVPVITYNATGQLTAVSSAMITPSAIGAPDVNGGGATGTWAINVSGSAGSLTGVTLNAHTVALGGNLSTGGAFSTSGSYDAALTLQGATNVTLPTSGVLATTAVSFNSQTSSYTTQLSDAQSVMVYMNCSTACNLTIPPNASVAYPVGSIINWEQAGAGALTLVEGSGVTLNKVSTLIAVGQYAMGGVMKTDTNTWTAFGALQ